MFRHGSTRFFRRQCDRSPEKKSRSAMPSAEATALTCHPCVADGRFDDVEKTPRFGCVLASFCPQVGVSSTSLRPSLRRNVQKKPKSACFEMCNYCYSSRSTTTITTSQPLQIHSPATWTCGPLTDTCSPTRVVAIYLFHIFCNTIFLLAESTAQQWLFENPTTRVINSGQ